MRLIIFILKCFVGLLDSIGFLLVGGAAAVVLLATQGDRLEALRGPQIPENTVNISEEGTARRVLRLMEALDDHEDVQTVHSNFDIPQEILDKLGEEQG